MEGLIEGKIVHFVLPDGKHAPAMIVKVWDKNSGMSNLQVFTDGSNDVPWTPEGKEKFANFGIDLQQVAHGHIWMTSRSYSEDMQPGTWHWIEKSVGLENRYVPRP